MISINVYFVSLQFIRGVNTGTLLVSQHIAWAWLLVLVGNCRFVHINLWSRKEKHQTHINEPKIPDFCLNIGNILNAFGAHPIFSATTSEVHPDYCHQTWTGLIGAASTCQRLFTSQGWNWGFFCFQLQGRLRYDVCFRAYNSWMADCQVDGLCKNSVNLNPIDYL